MLCLTLLILTIAARFTAAVPAAAAAATTVAGLPLGTPSSCPKYIVIEAPGLGDQKGFWTASTTNAILAGLKGGERYPLHPYVLDAHLGLIIRVLGDWAELRIIADKPAPPDGGQATGPQLISSAAEGSLEIVRVVAERTAQCPSVKFVIFGMPTLSEDQTSRQANEAGYSFGSIEVVLALNNPALLRTNIAAVLYYGNCFWHAGRVENRGTATSGESRCGGVEGIGAGTPPTYEGITADFCLKQDYLCTGSTYYARGHGPNTHWSYKGSTWQAQAAAFCIQRLKNNDNLGL